MAIISDEKWSAVVELHAAGKPDHEIAASVDISLSSVLKWRQRAGLPPNRAAKVQIDQGEAKRLYDHGRSDHEIAAQMGCTPTAIVRWRQRNSLPAKRRSKRMSDEQRRAATALLSKGAATDRVAERIETSSQTVKKLKRALAASGWKADIAMCGQLIETSDYEACCPSAAVFCRCLRTGRSA